MWLESSGDARERLPGEWVVAALAMRYRGKHLVLFLDFNADWAT